MMASGQNHSQRHIQQGRKTLSRLLIAARRFPKSNQAYREMKGNLAATWIMKKLRTKSFDDEFSPSLMSFWITFGMTKRCQY
jgi:hypothetical protein